MNTFYFTQRTSARIFTVIALFSLIAGMLPAQAFAIAPVNTYTVSSSPASVSFNGTQSVTFTVTNSLVSAGPLKAFFIALPAGFTVGSPTISSAAWGTLYNSSQNRIEASDSAGNAGNGLIPGGSVTVTVSATHAGATSGTFGWNVCAFKNNSFAPGGGAQFTPLTCLPASVTVNPPVVDVCPNITGAQATVPSGQMIDNAGNCVNIPTPPTDVCLNLLGVQTSVPTGYVANGTNCDPVIPPLDLCPNIDGPQATVPAGQMINNVGDCVDLPVPVACTVTIVSDATDFVIEKNANARLLSVINPAWTATLGSAAWIWGDDPVVDPTISETQTFQKKFGFIGNVTSATLEVASDNTHSAVVNGNTAHVDTSIGGITFGSPASYTVTSEIAQGNNELDITVTNTGVALSSFMTNPAGLKYKLTINGTVTTDSNCATDYVPPVVDVCPNDTGIQISVDQCTGGGGTDPVPGCMDETAVNYDVKATTDNDSCIYDYVSQCNVEAANLLVNGSFEDPVVTNTNLWYIFPAITGWAVSLSDGIELWRGLITPSDGVQNAELDGNDATKITQTVATIPGATYELRFDFAARTADAADNYIDAAIDGVSRINQSTSYTNWVTYGTTFVADASTDVSFEDLGTAQNPGGTGTLLDNAVLCLVRQPGEVVDVCSNIEENQATVPDGYTANDGVCTVNGGGGGGGHRHNKAPNGEVLGEATSTPEVLGDQVTAVPAGAPNAGAGSTSPFALSFYGVAPVAFIRRTRVHG